MGTTTEVSSRVRFQAGCFFTVGTFLFGEEDVSLATERVPCELTLIG